MKKSVIYYILPFVLAISSCSSGPNTSTPDKVSVIFKNYDDTVLYHTRVDYGTNASYFGEEPTKEATVDTYYSFSGWDKDLNQNLYESTVFYAQYAEETRKYLVTFMNYDDSVLATTNVAYGSYATFDDSIPSKPSDNERIGYTFSGWDKDLETTMIIEDTTFKAQYQMEQYVFASFVNFDNRLLQKVKVKEGNRPYYTGSAPYRYYAGEDKLYRFKGWDKPLVGITVDTTYIAQFDLINIYTVTFENYDGEVLQTEKVVHGEDATYTGPTPYHPSETSGDYIVSYTFYGWSGSLNNITSNVTLIARFTASSKATGATAIRNHLDAYGTGSYNNVETGYSSGGVSTLGYSGSDFYMGYTNIDSLETYMGISLTFGSTMGTGAFKIYDSGVLMFAATYYVYTSNHRYSSIECISISTNRYSTNDQMSAVAALTILSAQMAMDNASNYLAKCNLPYIF